MSKNTTPATTVDAAGVAVAPAAAEVVAKAPSKKSQAQAIFDAKLAEKTAGAYATNKEFRAAVLAAIQTDLGVSVASAATMYNSAKKDAETAGTVTLGRDPKKEKPASTGKRGRPAGSKNRAKETATVTVDVTAPAAEQTVEAPAAEPALV